MQLIGYREADRNSSYKIILFWRHIVWVEKQSTTCWIRKSIPHKGNLQRTLVNLNCKNSALSVGLVNLKLYLQSILSQRRLQFSISSLQDTVLR